MTPFVQRIQGSFRLKVILPAVVVMVAVLGTTGAMVNRGFNRRFETESADGLRRDADAFKQWREIRSRAQADRFRSLAHEPRVKGVMTTGDARTIRGVLLDLLDQMHLEAVMVADESGAHLGAASRNPSIRVAELEVSIRSAVEAALEGQVVTDVVVAAGSLIETVSVPVAVGPAGGGGVLTFADEAGQAAIQEFRRLGSSEVVLIHDNQFLGSTIPVGNSREEILAAYRRFDASGENGGPTGPRRVEIGGEHYLAVVGSLKPERPGRLGYLLLSSYERPLRELHSMQRTLAFIGLGGILGGSVAIWWLLSRVLKPLDILRAGAVAVGRGDLNHRVPVSGRDECGQLAEAFNQMTGSLLLSRNQLEAAHESLKSAQAQLIQKEKLSAVGEFVAGITHELNNPMAVILGYAQLLRREDLPKELHGHVRHIVAGVERCQKITRSLLAFARKGSSERVPVAINSILLETLEFLRYELLTSRIRIDQHLASNLPPIQADPQQLQQVFLNIVSNARQAMEEHHQGGTLTVTTASHGPWIRINFQDTGPGISQENLTRLFTPFFTTKPVGKGTGLGMSVSYGIIQDHGGEIRAESPPGSGARFVIDLPWGNGTAGTAGVHTAPVHPDSESAPPGPGRRALVMVDEAALLDLCRAELSHRGYRVVATTDLGAALLELSRDRFDVVLCDLQMPGASGRQTYEQVLKAAPDVARSFLFITDDTLDENNRGFVERSGRSCIARRFSSEQFDRALLRIPQVSRLPSRSESELRLP